jgi:hypothetical protein
MDTAKVQSKLSIDENEDIIISSKVERLNALISKSQVHGIGKVVIVSVIEISKTLSIDWVKICIAVFVNQTVALSGI